MQKTEEKTGKNSQLSCVCSITLVDDDEDDTCKTEMETQP